MKAIINMLESKWGKFEPAKTFLKQCVVGKGEYLNVIFKTLEKKKYSYIGELLDWDMPSDLRSFYEQCNGLSFFSESVRIFGGATDRQDEYKVIEIVHENVISKLKVKMPQYSDMIVIGGYGYYYFCVKRNFDGKYYAIGSVERKIVHTFDCLEALLGYYVGKLMGEYDKNGIKIHKDDEMIGSSFENTSFEAL